MNMFKQLKNILFAYLELVLDYIGGIKDTEAQRKYDICNSCIHRRKVFGVKVCGLCKCVLKAKVKCTWCKCPIDRW